MKEKVIIPETMSLTAIAAIIPTKTPQPAPEEVFSSELTLPAAPGYPRFPVP